MKDEQTDHEIGYTTGFETSGKKVNRPDFLSLAPSEDEKQIAQTSRNSVSCKNSVSKNTLENSVKKFDIFHSMNSSSASKSNLIRNEFLAKFEMSTNS